MGRSFTEGGWRHGAVGKLAGNDILTAVRRGHLWLNIKNLDINEPLFATLLLGIYQQLADITHEPVPDWLGATLLVSSPNAFVHYHADSIPNILWHVRGRKNIFLYPSNDSRYASAEDLEKICTGEIDEGLAYAATFESAAHCIELVPGMAAMWPQHMPHRVVNVDGLNVSLSTEHITRDIRARVNVFRGNRLLRKIGIVPQEQCIDGVFALAKRAMALGQRGFRKLQKKPPISYDLTPTFHVDPQSPTGYVDIEK